MKKPKKIKLVEIPEIFSSGYWHSREFFKIFTAAFERVAELSWIVTDKFKTKVPDFFKDLLRQPPIGGCSHRKGMGPYKNPETEFGRGGLGLIDYDVYQHTFIDGNQRIHCRRCGENWWKDQLGWEQAVEMTRQSTNRASASEQPLTSLTHEQLLKLRKNFTVTYFDDLLKEINGNGTTGPNKVADS